MGKKVINFGEFILLKESENSIEAGLPDKWSRLQELGFYDASTPIIKANGNILLKNDKFPYYPDGIILQISSGYVRDKGVKSGFIKKDYTLDQMVDYLIHRFEEYENATSELPPAATILLKKISKSKSARNSETGRYDFPGSAEVSRDQLEKLKEFGIKLGVIGKNFAYNGGKDGTLTLEDLEFFPVEVKERLELRNCLLVGFSDLRALPTKMGNALSLSSVTNLKSLSGCTLKPGKRTEIMIYACRDLETLGDDLPDEVDELRIIPSYSSEETIPLSSLKGYPKIIHGRFIVAGTRIKNLEGGPEQILGGESSLENNEFLNSLEGFPFEYEGGIKTDIIKCQFGLVDRLTIVSRGLYKELPFDSMKKATPEQIKFVATSIPLESVQSLIDQNPERMAITLKELIKDPYFKSLRWPENLKGEVDLLSALSDVGL